MPGYEQDLEKGGARPAGYVPLERDRPPQEEIHAAEGPALSPENADAGSVFRLQQTAGNAAVSSMLAPTPGDLVRSVVDAPGRPLDGSTRSFVESSLGQDASGIRVHEGPDAAAAARSVDAELFASGHHLVAPSGLNVTTQEGAFKTLHEVHHIVNQQAKGPVDGTETADGLKISDPSDHFEREANEAAAQGVSSQFSPAEAPAMEDPGASGSGD
jgi:hypothetical protein